MGTRVRGKTGCTRCSLNTSKRANLRISVCGRDGDLLRDRSKFNANFYRLIGSGLSEDLHGGFLRDWIAALAGWYLGNKTWDAAVREYRLKSGLNEKDLERVFGTQGVVLEILQQLGNIDPIGQFVDWLADDVADIDCLCRLQSAQLAYDYLLWKKDFLRHMFNTNGGKWQCEDDRVVYNYLVLVDIPNALKSLAKLKLECAPWWR